MQTMLNKFVITSSGAVNISPHLFLSDTPFLSTRLPEERAVAREIDINHLSQFTAVYFPIDGLCRSDSKGYREVFIQHRFHVSLVE